MDSLQGMANRKKDQLITYVTQEETGTNQILLGYLDTCDHQADRDKGEVALINVMSYRPFL